MAVKFANLASSTLSGAITNSATSITVSDASSFPTLGSGDYFYASLGEGTGSEIVKVTAVSTNTFTVTRAQDGTSAQAWSSGTVIALRVVAAALDDIASQAQTAADTESVSIDGDTMTGALTVPSIDINGNATVQGYLNFDGGSQNGLVRFGGNNAVGYSGNFLYINPSNHFTNGVYINSSVKVDGGLLGSYNEDLQLRTGTTTALTLDYTDQSATFAGSITSGAITSSGHIITSASSRIENGRISMEADGTLDWGATKNYGTLTWDIGKIIVRGQSGNAIEFQTNGSSVAATFDTSQNATFNGSVNVSGDLNIASVLAHTGDLDTYFQFNAANTARIVVGGSQKFVVNTSGVSINNGTLNMTSNNISNVANIGAASGYVSGKFAVKSTSVHGSYDFYNNGTTYLNGSTTVDDVLDITGSSASLRIGGTEVISIGRSISNATIASSVTATTQSASDNSTKVATTAYVDSAVSGIVDSAPGTLNTLNELAAALGDDANFSTTVTNSIATKLPKAGGTVTGNLYSTSTASNAIHTRFIAGAANASTADGPLYLQYGKSQDIRMFEASGANRKLYIYGNDNGTDRWGGLSVGADGSFTVQASDTYLILQAGSYIQSNNPHNFTSSLMTSGTTWLDSARNATFTSLNLSNSSDVFLKMTPSNGSADPVLQMNGQSGIATEGFEVWYDNNIGDVHLHTTYNHNDASIRFHTKTGASKGTSNERFRIDGSGYTQITSHTNSWDGGLRMVSSDGTDTFKIHPDNNGYMYVDKNWYFTGAVSIGSIGQYAWHSGNDGSGSGLDADTVDGYGLEHMFRTKTYTSGYSSTSDQWYTLFSISESTTPVYVTLKNGAHSTATFVVSTGYSGSNEADLTVLNSTWTQNGSYPGAQRVRVVKQSNATYNVQIKLHWTSSTVAGFSLYCKMWGSTPASPLPSFASSLSAETGSPTVIREARCDLDRMNFSTVPYVGDNIMWHAGNDGPGSGLAADTVDGLHAASFLRSDADDSATGALTFSGSILSRGHSSGDNWMPYTDGDFYIRAPNTFFDANVEFNDEARVVTGSIAASNSTKGLMFDGNYQTGQYRHRFRKVDNGGGVPLYLDRSHGTANSYTTIARFGPYTNNSQEFEVYGDARVTGSIDIGVYSTTTGGNLYLNGTTANKRAKLFCSNGNLHIDSNSGNATYLNYVSGNGTYFGGGAGNVVAVMGPDGDLWKGSGDNSGSKYWHAGNDGSGSGLDADTVDSIQASSILHKLNNTGYYRPNDWIDFRDAGTAGLYWGSGGASGWHIHPTGTEDVRLRSGANHVGVELNASGTTKGYVYANSSNEIGFLNNSRQWRFLVPATHSASFIRYNGSTANTIWDSGNDGSSSGLDADMVDGMHRYNHHGVGELQTIEINGDEDKYYPVVITGGSTINSEFEIYRGFNELAPSSWNSATHPGGLTFRYRITGSSGWGGYPTKIHVYEAGEIYTTVLGGIAYTAHSMKHVVWLRGGGTNGARYHIFSPSDFSVVIYDDTSSGYTSGSGWLSYDSSNNAYDTYVDYRTLTQRNAAMEGEIYNNMAVSYSNAKTHHVLNGTGPAKTFWHTSNDGSNSGLDADLLDGVHGSSFLRSDAADTAARRITFSANDTHNYDTIATTSSSQGCIEIYNSGAGNDAFMSFHVGGDYAIYFGLDGGTNKLSVGGWSMGANSYEIYHAGNKPSLAALGYTGATNANYITNNNQLTNGAGYQTTSGNVRVLNTYQGSASTNSLQYWQASGQNSDYAPDGSWYNTIRGGHGNPHTYYSNTLAMKMTGSGVGTIYTQALSNGTFQGWNKHWHANNDGSGSGLDADLLDGLELHTGRNNNANKVVRTDGNGYIQAGWINTTSGDRGTTAMDRIYASNDGYIRYYTPANFGSQIAAHVTRLKHFNNFLNLSTSVGSGANLNTTFQNGKSGFFDVWGGSAGSNNKPPGTTHVQGVQVRHSTSTHYGWQIASQYNQQAIYKRTITNNSFGSWDQIWTAGTDGSGSGLDADRLRSYAPAQSGGNTIHLLASNGYSQINNWIFVGTQGIYSGTNSAHFYPTTSTYGTWRINGSRGGYTGIWLDYSNVNIGMYDSSGNGGDYSSSATGGWHYYYHRSNRCMGIGGSSTSSSYGLYEQGGGIYSTGNVTAYSDRRIKENIVTIDNALEKVNQLEGVYYTRIDDPDKNREIGFIAQDVNEVTPELVTYAEDVDQYGVKYQNATALLVEAVKTLTQQVKDLQAEIEELKNA